jgi:hypothetical protein
VSASLRRQYSPTQAKRRLEWATRRYSGRATYTADEIDFIAAFVAPHDAWYVIPLDALSGRKFIRVYPGVKMRAKAGLFEQYREAWHLLKDW